MALRLFVIYTLLFMLLDTKMYSAVVIDINPRRFDGDGSTNTVQVSCSLDQTEANARELLVMKITRKGEKALVILNKNNTVSYGEDAREQYEATGKITSPLSNTKITMRIKTPATHHTGTYTCYIYYMDADGKLKEDRSSSYLTVLDPRVKVVKAEIKKFKQWLIEKQKLRRTLDTKVTRDEQRLKQLEPLVQKMSNMNGASPLVAFSVTCLGRFIFPKQGQGLVFPDVIMQVGQGYNRNTGVFTAPVSGLYAFHLLVETSCKGCHVVIQLWGNNQIQGTLKAGHPSDTHQNSISAVIKLGVGKKVKPQVSSASSDTYLNYEKRTVFTGYLVKAG